LITAEGLPTAYFFSWLSLLYSLLQGTLGKGFSGTVTTAKLTGGGTNGSITFVNGVVTSQVPAT
jgi:hypothetical protein